MPVYPPQPRELLVSTYTAVGTATGASAAAGDGIALSTTWGGSFTVGKRTSLEVECYVPYIATTTGSTSIWAEVHVMVNSVCRLKFFKLNTVANVDGSSAHGKARFTLSAGTYNAAVFLKVSGSGITGYVSAGTDNPGLLIVREAPF